MKYEITEYGPDFSQGTGDTSENRADLEELVKVYTSNLTEEERENWSYIITEVE